MIVKKEYHEIVRLKHDVLYAGSCTENTPRYPKIKIMNKKNIKNAILARSEKKNSIYSQ